MYLLSQVQSFMNMCMLNESIRRRLLRKGCVNDHLLFSDGNSFKYPVKQSFSILNLLKKCFTIVKTLL